MLNSSPRGEISPGGGKQITLKKLETMLWFPGSFPPPPLPPLVSGNPSIIHREGPCWQLHSRHFTFPLWVTSSTPPPSPEKNGGSVTATNQAESPYIHSYIQYQQIRVCAGYNRSSLTEYKALYSKPLPRPPHGRALIAKFRHDTKNLVM